MHSSSEPHTIRDQYQHYIPRFILRRFQTDTSEKRKPKKQRQREYKLVKKNPSLSTENVLVYDVVTGILESRPVGMVYGEMNLYKDIRNGTNFNHIEEKLSRLESDAAVFVNNLHAAVSGGRNVCVTRKELGIFREFLFIMFYHPGTYCKEDHPENAPLSDWIRKRKQDMGLKDDKDVWIDDIQCHIEHPHHVLVAEGEKALEKIGGAEAFVTAERIDPDINMYALEYANVANEYFMGIWEATDGSEFVIGSNSFGLWGGLVIGGGLGIHRIFVLSLRLVIVLRNIIVQPAAPRYVNYKGKGIGPTGFENKDWTIEKYRISDVAQKDTYTFKITKPSKKQTRAVNNVSLLNINEGGSVTFASRCCMLDTMHAYFDAPGHRFKKSKTKYTSLLNELLLVHPATRVSTQKFP